MLVSAGVAWTGCALAEKADRAKPINFQADRLVSDGVRQESVITGNVIMTKGSILVRADQVIVRDDPQGYQHAVLTAWSGKRAFFREKREGGDDEFIEGEAEVIEYDGYADSVRLIRGSVLRQWRGETLSGETAGGIIRYNNLTSQVQVDGDAAGSAGALRGRMRGMLMPRRMQEPKAAVDGIELRAAPAMPAYRD
jgi:lipopolysaccharide export system protein LptA